jgi:hypothetical protein
MSTVVDPDPARSRSPLNADLDQKHCPGRKFLGSDPGSRIEKFRDPGMVIKHPRSTTLLNLQFKN